MKEMRTGTFTYNDESYNFDFSTDLSAYDKLIFVKTVTDSLVDDYGYNFVVKDLIFDFAIIAVFTNIDTSFVNMKDDDGEDVNPIIPIEHFLEETNVVDIVKANMRSGLIDELNRAVDLNIQYVTGIHTNPVSDAIARLLNTIGNSIGESDVGDLMEYVKNISAMTQGIAPEDIPENIVKFYMNSDEHKKNVIDIEESKKTKKDKK
jgi:hypothetical protein